MLMKKPNYSLKSSWLNKYTLTCLVFILWISFVDDKYNFIKQHKLTKKVEDLEEQKQTLVRKLKEAIIEYDELKDNQEKFAREKYFVSKEGEDVFIIDTK